MHEFKGAEITSRSKTSFYISRLVQEQSRHVDGVDFELDSNRAVVVVLGESGCGKSSLAKAILRLLPRNVEKYTGHVRLQNIDVMAYDDEEFRKNVRGWESQGAAGGQNSLNPVIKVGRSGC